MKTHDLEETIFHEATHATLEKDHAKSEKWLEAQKKDGDFITKYAKRLPLKEDLPESALFCLHGLKTPGPTSRESGSDGPQNHASPSCLFSGAFREGA